MEKVVVVATHSALLVWDHKFLRVGGDGARVLGKSATFPEPAPPAPPSKLSELWENGGTFEIRPAPKLPHLPFLPPLGSAAFRSGQALVRFGSVQMNMAALV